MCLLAGSKSISFAQSATDTLAGALPNATPLVLAGQAHTAMDTDPEGFVAAVKAFALRTQVSRAA